MPDRGRRLAVTGREYNLRRVSPIRENVIRDRRFAQTETIADAARRILGTRSARVAVVGDDGGMAWPRSWLRCDIDDPSGADALLWLAGGEGVDHHLLARWHAALPARGRLLLGITDPPDDAARHDEAMTPRQRALAALSAAGFVILDDLVLRQGRALIVCRPGGVTIRGFEPGDETAIDALFTRSFHVRRSLDAWRWKFFDHPWGRQHISLAWKDGELVGQYAAVPMRWVDANGEEDRALQLCDIMTAPCVRGEGRGRTAVLVRMLRHLYAHWGEQRIGFVIGWNTATSRAFALRFTEGEDVERVAFWRGPPSFARPPRGYRVRAVETFDRPFDRFFARIAPRYGYLQRRDAAYLDWRFRQPGADYLPLACTRWGRLIGWSVFRRDGAVLRWGDALIDPRYPDAAAALLHAAGSSALGAGCEAMEAWFSERPPWWRSCLLGLGFRRCPEPNDLRLIFGVHRTPDAGDRLARAYYTMADSDLF